MDRSSTKAKHFFEFKYIERTKGEDKDAFRDTSSALRDVQFGSISPRPRPTDIALFRKNFRDSSSPLLAGMPPT
jgi:hypothetical protein